MWRSSASPAMSCNVCCKHSGGLYCWKRRGPRPLLSSDSSDVSDIEGNLTWVQSTGVLTNIILGLGVVNIPHAVKDADGIVSAVIVMLVCSLLVILSFWLLAECADLVPDCKTYQQMVGYYLGKPGEWICNVFLFINNFGACVTLVLILGDQIESIITVITPSVGFTLRFILTFSMCYIFILPLCFGDKMEHFKIISWMGVLTIVYLASLIVFTYYTRATDDTPPDYTTNRLLGNLDHVRSIFNIIPVMVFSLDGHIEAVPLYAELKNQSPNEFLKTAIATVTTCSVIFTVVGAYGYLLMGNNTPGDILLAFDQKDVAAICARVFVTVKIITTFPPVFFCVRLVTQSVVRKAVNKLPMSYQKQPCFIPIVEVVPLFTLMVFLATLIPNLGSAVSILAGSAALFVFIFPGICYCQLHLPWWNERYTSVLLGIFMTLFGTFIAGFSFVYGILLLAKSV